jgi:hypothetical protein
MCPVLTQRRPLVSLLGGAAGVTANKGKNESTSISEPMRGIAGSEWLPLLIVLRPESKGGCEAALSRSAICVRFNLERTP